MYVSLFISTPSTAPPRIPSPTAVLSCLKLSINLANVIQKPQSWATRI